MKVEIGIIIPLEHAVRKGKALEGVTNIT